MEGGCILAVYRNEDLRNIGALAAVERMSHVFHPACKIIAGGILPLDAISAVGYLLESTGHAQHNAIAIRAAWLSVVNVDFYCHFQTTY